MNRFERSGPGFAVGIITLSIMVALVVMAAMVRAQAVSFTVTTAGTSNYTINAQPDPDLTLVRGVSYTFEITAPGHPFYVKTEPVTGTGSQYNDGVANNGATSGTLTFTVPPSAPNALFYQCSVHGAMTGEIHVVGPAPAVPGVNAVQLVALGTLLLGLGAAILRLMKRPVGPA